MYESQSTTYFNLVCTFSTLSVLFFLMGIIKKCLKMKTTKILKL